VLSDHDGSGVGLFAWVSDSASLWTSAFQQVRISDGAILNKSVRLSATRRSSPR
jgi:hypothetical protein